MRDDSDRDGEDEIEVTSDMIEAGEEVIFSEQGVAPLGFSFSPAELVEQVYRAMERPRRASRGQAPPQNLLE